MGGKDIVQGNCIPAIENLRSLTGNLRSYIERLRSLIEDLRP